MTEPTSAGDVLAAQARGLLPILRRQARRPYIIELAGTPKAGKTSALQVVHRFLKDCGYQVQEMRERAADCPVAMKGHFFFNSWTTTTMLASMIESLESEADVVLLDRGVFDALVWLEAQSRDHQVSDREREVFRDFVLLERWRDLTDLTFVLRVEPAEALRRENQDLLIPRSGSIMDEGFLARYNSVLGQVQADMQGQFELVDVDTTALGSPRAVRESIVAALLEHMRRWADPEIAAIPRAVIERMFADDGPREIAAVLPELEGSLVVRHRSTLEGNDEYVQLVSAAVLRHEGKVLLLRRATLHDEKRTKFGRDLLWKGCHVPASPTPAVGLLGTAAEAIKARIKEDLHLARFESDPIPRFVVWNRHPEEAHHLGIFFDVDVAAPEVARSLAEKVFKRERERTKLHGSRFVAPAELLARVERGDDVQLESWSREVLPHLVARS